MLCGVESVNPNAYTVQKSHIEMEAESKKNRHGSTIMMGRKHLASVGVNCRECWRLWKNEESSSSRKRQ